MPNARFSRRAQLIATGRGVSGSQEFAGCFAASMPDAPALPLPAASRAGRARRDTSQVHARRRHKRRRPRHQLQRLEYEVAERQRLRRERQRQVPGFASE